MRNLVGETVRFSSKNRFDGSITTRSILINSEITQDGRRYYHVNDIKGGEPFYVIADKYDSFFLINRSSIEPNGDHKK